MYAICFSSVFDYAQLTGTNLQFPYVDWTRHVKLENTRSCQSCEGWKNWPNTANSPADPENEGNHDTLSQYCAETIKNMPKCSIVWRSSFSFGVQHCLLLGDCSFPGGDFGVRCMCLVLCDFARRRSWSDRLVLVTGEARAICSCCPRNWRHENKWRVCRCTIGAQTNHLLQPPKTQHSRDKGNGDISCRKKKQKKNTAAVKIRCQSRAAVCSPWVTSLWVSERRSHESDPTMKNECAAKNDLWSSSSRETISFLLLTERWPVSFRWKQTENFPLHLVTNKTNRIKEITVAEKNLAFNYAITAVLCLFWAPTEMKTRLSKQEKSHRRLLSDCMSKTIVWM